MGNLGSLFVVLLAFVIAYWLRFDQTQPDTQYLLVLLLGMLLASVILPATGAFRKEFSHGIARRLRRLIAGWALVVTALVAFAAMWKVTAEFSRVWFGSWVLLTTVGLGLLVIINYALRRLALKRGAQKRPIVLVGSGEAAELFEQRLHRDPEGNFKLLARFGSAWGDAPVRPVDDLCAFLTGNEVKEVWIATDLSEKALLDATLAAIRDQVLDVYLVPDLRQYRLLNQNVAEWQGLPVVSLSGTPTTGAEWRLKGVVDRVGAFVILSLVSPLLLLIAGAIKASSAGPVFFRQKRHGIGGEEIAVLKFRTMKVHREPTGQMTQAVRGDTRVTAIGKFLRRTSLDELPQLINVLNGDMSLVGPRPHPVELDGFFRSRIPRYMLRNKVKPGITGWAQVNGLRGITDTDEKMALRIEHDLWYIQNWSLWLDLSILLRTPLSMIHRNAF